MGEFPSLLKVDVSAMYFLAGREMVYCCSQPYHSLLILPIFMGRPLEVSVPSSSCYKLFVRPILDNSSTMKHIDHIGLLSCVKLLRNRDCSASVSSCFHCRLNPSFGLGVYCRR